MMKNNKKMPRIADFTFTLLALSILTSLLIPLFATIAQAADNAGSQNPRPKIGLVLSGGGALGLAHIGVLRVLEDMHIPVDCITGTSMGALVGGAYAAGIDPELMETRILNTDIGALFDDLPSRNNIPQKIKRDDYKPLFNISLGLNDFNIQMPSAASAGYKFELFLKELIGKEISQSDLKFDSLSIPFRAMTTDIETGALKVFNQGDLAKVLRASMSLPAIVAPMKIGDRSYIDGGMVRNLPVDVARNLCAETIIAVNLGTKPKTQENLTNTIEVAWQTLTLLTEQNVENSLAELKPEDIIITPDLSDFSITSFNSQKEIIDAGVKAAQANEKLLSKLSIPVEDYRHWQLERKNKKLSPIEISRIRFKTDLKASKEVLISNLNIEPNKRLSTHDLHEKLINLYGTGDFSYVGYSIETENDNPVLIIDAEQKRWGPGYLKFGLETASDFSSPTQLNIAASHRRTWLNPYGAELDTDLKLGYESQAKLKFLQPLLAQQGTFIAPYIDFQRYYAQIYSKQRNIGKYEIRFLQGGVNVGINGKFGEMSIGPYRRATKETPDYGLLTDVLNNLLGDHEYTQNGILFRATYDQLDRVTFPRAGLSSDLTVDSSTTSGSTEDKYVRAMFKFVGAKTFSKTSIVTRFEWGSSYVNGKQNISIADSFTLGGPRRLAGLYIDQLNGSRYELESLDIFYQNAYIPPQFGRGVYTGMTLQSGNISGLSLDDASLKRLYSAGVYIGADTILGAVYLAYGYSTLENQRSLYLIIGPRF